jgi:hypothetical protein
LKRSLSILVLLGIAALVAFSPASLAAKKKCVSMKEHAGCKLKLAAYTGRESSGGPMLGARLSIDAENGPARVTGGVRGKCSGGGADGSTTYLPILTAPRFPKTLVVGKTYSKSAHIDRTETSPGSNGAHLVATETIKIDVLSAKRARVTVSTDQSSNFETTADDPRHCKGSGSEKLKRRY